MKQNKKRIIAIAVATGMCASLSTGYIPKETSASVANDEKDTFIVQMEDREMLGEISEKYNKQISENSESYDSLENQNCIVLDLSKSQAAGLSSAEGVDFIESDMEMQGTADEMTTVSECDTEWNLNMVNADLEENMAEDNDKAVPIKVAVIDSGIDYTNGINVVKRKNFIPDEDDVNILYEDMSGHGTSVAGIIAASGVENEDLTGIAKNAEIYSAKVLNSCNKAPISRVVEGIYWAIEQGVDIINLSLGTSKPSELLEKAVKDAYDKGILLIASAGNNEKAGVEYPAAYDEVMAVASVNSQGEHSSKSAVGEKVEIAAPGEKVKAASCFDGEIVVSGTSIATPHITAIAARLWERDRTKSAQFIRGLIDASANAVGEKSEYGYGIADLSYAMEIYDEYAKNYVEDSKESVEETLENIEDTTKLTENDAKIEIYENDYVEGRWVGASHEKLAEEQGTITNANLLVLKWGAFVSDKKIGFSGMKRHPCLHGFGYGMNTYLGTKKRTNYIASYIYLTKMAFAFYSKSTYTPPKQIDGLLSYDYNFLRDSADSKGMHGTKEDGSTVNYSWSYMLTRTDKDGTEQYSVTRTNQALLLYGMALHTATDAFAHSAYQLSTRIIHEDNGKKMADNEGYCDNRYKCAKEVAKNILTHVTEKNYVASVNVGRVNDWVIPSNKFDGSFQLAGLSEYAKAANSTEYSLGKKNFDNMNLNINDIISNRD